MVTSSDFTFTTSTAGGTLTTGLVSYWTLNETSGARADSQGTNALAVSGTSVGSTTGKQGNAAVFTSGNMLYSTATPSWPGLGIAGWIKIASVGPSNFQCVISQFGSTLQSFALLYDHGVGAFKLVVSPTGSTYSEVDLPMSITFGTWYFVAASWNGTQLQLSVNNGTVATAAFAGPIYHSSDGLTLGYFGGNYSDCTIDELGIWSRALTATEVTQLYASGSGVTWPLP
jgi:hypothetical protein